MKPSLTPQEQIAAAYAHYIDGVPQQAIATLFATNIGRVNEAVKKIGGVVGLCEPSYKDKDKDKEKEPHS